MPINKLVALVSALVSAIASPAAEVIVSPPEPVPEPWLSILIPIWLVKVTDGDPVA